MAEDQIARKLTTIMAADVAGYSRLMGADEEATARTFKSYRQAIDRLIAKHRGRVFGGAGDSVIAEFASPVEAVRCAVEFQRDVEKRNAKLEEARRMRFRIGVNLGDVMIDGDDLLGDGVNVAARLEALADTGGVCISGAVFEQIESKLDVAFEDAGEQKVKNIAKPVRVYRLRRDDADGVEADAAANDAMPALELPDKPSIAVLAFDNLSGDPEQEYLSDGIAEDITTALSAFRWLFVIARNSSFTYKGRAVNLTQVARELGVRYVLEGSVRKSSDRLRISAQLVDATTGSHVWAERYDRHLDDIFDLQDDMTQTIVAALEPELATAERERATRKPPDNLGAWEAYQRGLSHLYRFSKDELVEAKKLLARAVELDPTFAPAYAGLAMVHFYEIQWMTEDSGKRAERIDQGLKLAAKAVALDNNDAMGHMALGRINVLKGDPVTAIAELETGVDLNPNSAAAYGALSWAESFAGDVEAGMGHGQRALRLSPRDPQKWVAMNAITYCLIRLQKWDEALDWARRTVREPHSYFWPYAHVVVCLVQLDRMEEARQAMNELLKMRPTFSVRSHDKAVSWVVDRESQDRYFGALRKAGLPE